jgi:hypothetical protein
MTLDELIEHLQGLREEAGRGDCEVLIYKNCQIYGPDGWKQDTCDQIAASRDCITASKNYSREIDSEGNQIPYVPEIVIEV